MQTSEIYARFNTIESSLKDPVLQMLSRDRNASFCITMVSTVFEKAAEPLPKQVFLNRLSEAIDLYRNCTDLEFPSWSLSDDGVYDSSEAVANRIYKALSTPVSRDNGYGWIRYERDERSLDESVAISTSGLSALDTLDRLDKSDLGFTAVKADDFVGQMDDLISMLSTDKEERIEQLRRKIEPYEKEIKRLEAYENASVTPASTREVKERLRHMYDIVGSMPTSIRRTRDAEKRSIEDISDRYRSGLENSASLIKSYTDEFVDRFETGDDGKSFRNARETIYTLESNRNLEQLKSSIDIGTIYDEEIDELFKNIQAKLSDIFLELKGVDKTFGEGLNLLQRLTTARKSMKWRARYMDVVRAQENFKEWSQTVKGSNPKLSLSLPYGNGRVNYQFPHALTNISGKAKPLPVAKAAVDEDFDAAAQLDDAVKLSSGDAFRVIGKMKQYLSPDENDKCNLVSAFNSLAEEDRLVQDMAALFCEFGGGDKTARLYWKTVDINMNRQVYATGKLLVSMSDIEAFEDSRKELLECRK